MRPFAPNETKNVLFINLSIYTLIWNASRCNLVLERILGELADVFFSPDVSEKRAGGGI